MMAILAVSQKGPKSERRYRCKISFHPILPQRRRGATPAPTSLIVRSNDAWQPARVTIRVQATVE